MSCDEYDRSLADPVKFRSAFELENERVDREREAEERRRREMEAADLSSRGVWWRKRKPD